MSHVQHTAFTGASVVPPFTHDDPITADLRAFALEVGVAGASAMSKEELVEGLRQFHVLQQVLAGATAGSERR